VVNWWVLSAVTVEVIGAFLIARGLASETPEQWVSGRGTPRWDYGADADLSYAASSTDAAVGFVVLVVGLILQGANALDPSNRGEFWLLAVPVLIVGLAEVTRRRRTSRREASVMRLRIEASVVDGKDQPESWASIVHGYSNALGNSGRRPRDGEDAWSHLDRVYRRAWLSDAAKGRLRQSYETYVSIETRAELGDLWLPWFVRVDEPAEPIRDLDRSNARQLRVRDAIEDPAVMPALQIEDADPHGGTWSHVGRIDHYKTEWSELTGVSQGPFPALRTPDGPVLVDGCHRCCAIYAMNLPEWRVGLELSDPPAGHPDTQAGPREAAT